MKARDLKDLCYGLHDHQDVQLCTYQSHKRKAPDWGERLQVFGLILWVIAIIVWLTSIIAGLVL